MHYKKLLLVSVSCLAIFNCSTTRNTSITYNNPVTEIAQPENVSTDTDTQIENTTVNKNGNDQKKEGETKTTPDTVNFQSGKTDGIQDNVEPPQRLTVYVRVKNGLIIAYKCLPMNYPGALKKIAHKKLENGVVNITLQSKYDPSIEWVISSPGLEDGDHVVYADLKRGTN